MMPGLMIGEPVRDVKRKALELIEEGHHQIRRELGHELLEYTINSSPEFFERLVIDLLVRMGYGGSIKDAGKAIGRVGDEGIDGVIKEDMLGLDNIYVQAKRWKNAVGRPVLQSLVGALQGKKAEKAYSLQHLLSVKKSDVLK